MMDMTGSGIDKSRNGLAAVPAGKYVLGDPCYSVPDKLWHKLLDSCGIFGCEANGSCVGKIEVDGKTYHVLGFGTAYGDGSYRGSDGNVYCVDAGMIGLVPYDLAIMKKDWQENYLDVGIVQVVEFTDPVMCKNDGGDMEFGHIKIETDYCADDEDEDDGYNEYEDDGDGTYYRR